MTAATTAQPASTRFANLFDLARLPYFELRGGRLVLADQALAGAIDLHSHLALSYGLPARVDLRKAHAETLHYLPKDRAFDLELYINKNFVTDDLKRLERDLSLKSLTASGMRKTHTVPNLAREMDELGITSSVLLPIDMPVLSKNAVTWLRAIDGRPEMIGFGSVHPFARNPEAKLDEQIRLGARGLKVHPAVQLVGPDHPRAMKLYKLCGARGLPVLFHCGPVGIELAIGRRLSQVRRYEKPIAETPETTFVLGHSGALQMEEAVLLAKKYPNVWLELSSQSLGNVRRIVHGTDPDRIVYGSDWPFYHQAIGLAKVFLATEGHDALRKKVMFENAQRLLRIAPC